MEENHWWDTDVESKTKENAYRSIQTVQTLSSVKEMLYELSGDFDDSPFEKDVEYYVQIIDEMCEFATDERDWNNDWNNEIPQEIIPKLKELYTELKNVDDDDDIIEA